MIVFMLSVSKALGSSSSIKNKRKKSQKQRKRRERREMKGEKIQNLNEILKKNYLGIK